MHSNRQESTKFFCNLGVTSNKSAFNPELAPLQSTGGGVDGSTGSLRWFFALVPREVNDIAW